MVTLEAHHVLPGLHMTINESPSTSRWLFEACYDYIYEAMDKEKEYIQNNFSKKKKPNMRMFGRSLMDEEFRLHKPLYATGYSLNPK